MFLTVSVFYGRVFSFVDVVVHSVYYLVSEISYLQDIMELNCEIYAEKPQKDIHAFVGTYKLSGGGLLILGFVISLFDGASGVEYGLIFVFLYMVLLVEGGVRTVISPFRVADRHRGQCTGRVSECGERSLGEYGARIWNGARHCGRCLMFI